MTHVTLLERIVPAPASTTFGIVVDIAAYPSWCPDVTHAQVLRCHPDGSPSLARLRFDAPPLRDEMVFAYEVRRQPGTSSVTWRLQEAGVVRALEGSYAVTPRPDDTCLVRYCLSVDVGLALHRLMREKIQARIATSALDALEAAAPASRPPS